MQCKTNENNQGKKTNNRQSCRSVYVSFSFLCIINIVAQSVMNKLVGSDNFRFAKS